MRHSKRQRGSMHDTSLSVAAVLGCLAISASSALAAAVVAVQPQNPAPPPIRFEPVEPTLTVNGRGEVSVTPDRAVVRLGAVVQAPNAAEAQSQVNGIVTKAIEGIRALGIAEERIGTQTLDLSPVYEMPPPHPVQGGEGEPPESREPRIVAYRASNTIRVEVDDLTKVGPVIDAGVAAGANNVEGISFELQDDAAARRDALAKAVEEARAKARIMAAALEVEIAGVLEATEGGVDLYPVQYDLGRRAFAGAEMAMATPVQPGQVRVEASVTIRYRIGQSQREVGRGGW